MNDREAVIRALALLQAHARTQDSVYMDGRHNPLPTEEQKARMFVEDHIDPLLDQLDAARQEIEARRERGMQLEEILDAVRAERDEVKRGLTDA